MSTVLYSVQYIIPKGEQPLRLQYDRRVPSRVPVLVSARYHGTKYQATAGRRRYEPVEYGNVDTASIA